MSVRTEALRTARRRPPDRSSGRRRCPSARTSRPRRRRTAGGWRTSPTGPAAPASGSATSARPGPSRCRTGDEPVLAVSWSPDGRWLACVVAPGGAPRTELWVVRPDGTGRRQVAGFGRRSADACPAGCPTASVLAVTETAERATAVLVDAASGHRRVLAEGDLLTLLDVTPDAGARPAAPRPAQRPLAGLLDVATGVRASAAAGHRPGQHRAGLVRPRRGERAAPAPTRSPNSPRWCGSTSPGRSRRRRGSPRRADAELEHVAVSADRRRAALLWNTYGGRSEVSLLDLASGVQRAVAAPGEVVDGAVFAADGDLLCLTAQGPVQPREVWLVDPATATPRPLRPDTAAARTPGSGVAPQLVDLRARDGLPLSGWLYRPPGPGPWPTAISLHGGPEAQERPGYNPLFQALVGAGRRGLRPERAGLVRLRPLLRRRRQPRRRGTARSPTWRRAPTTCSTAGSPFRVSSAAWAAPTAAT